jgi:diketogulonate reductase-like aldo/keto reductase
VAHLVTLQSQGLLTHIGCSNYDSKMLTELLDSGIRIVANQVQHCACVTKCGH